MIGSPSIQHKPPEPGYIDVIQSIPKWNPYITRCGRVGKNIAPTPRPSVVPRSSCVRQLAGHKRILDGVESTT